MNRLKNPFGVTAITCAVVVLAAVAPALAQTNSQTEQPRVVLGRTNHLKATVAGIDYNNRELVLQGTSGQLGHFAVSDAVKNFNHIKPGDQLNIEYYESVAYALAKPGEPLTPTSRVNALATRDLGQRPGGVAISVENTTATIQDIDRENRQVTLKGANGESVNVYVDPSVGNLQRINKGDQVSVTYTRGFAVSVTNPPTVQALPMRRHGEPFLGPAANQLINTRLSENDDFSLILGSPLY